MKTSRIEAIKAGDRHYYTGKKCKFGHLSKRMTTDGSCVECRLTKQREERAQIRKAVNSC